MNSNKAKEIGGLLLATFVLAGCESADPTGSNSPNVSGGWSLLTGPAETTYYWLEQEGTGVDLTASTGDPQQACEFFRGALVGNELVFKDDGRGITWKWEFSEDGRQFEASREREGVVGPINPPGGGFVPRNVQEFTSAQPGVPAEFPGCIGSEGGADAFESPDGSSVTRRLREG